MLKFVYTICCLLLLTSLSHSQLQLGNEVDDMINLLKPNPCPKYTAQANIDEEKMAGTWYDLASTDPFFTGKKCSRNDVVNNPDGTVSLNMSLIMTADGSPLKLQILYQTTDEEPGALCFEQDVQEKMLFGITTNRKVSIKMTPVYTDYDNIVVYYQCWNEKSNLIEKRNEQAYILTRKRGFDTLSQFVKTAGPLIGLGINLNRLMFIENGNDCSN